MELSDIANWDWSGLIQVILGAGLGTAAVQTLLTIWRDFRQKRALASYMALRLAVILEEYARLCVELIAYNADPPQRPEDELPLWRTDLPLLPVYPDDPDGWRALDGRLAARCLNLRNRIAGSFAIVRSTIDFDETLAGEEVDLQAASRGTEAWQIACDLRKNYGIEPVDLVWDFTPQLGETIAKIERERLERRREQEERGRRYFEMLKSLEGH